ncbi:MULTISPECIES: 4'-phosphopantetheinyl transferase superfamily protein [unclassified Janthinobacterium]|uniref:4'-phosphopantetheinyl transferase family protein n=1 Tax=unclassified Janthinobacterium TaxID=2610881 RepID=UPI000890FCAC|nr:MULTISPECIES: 4'-phosphopantetheinyl transferase superfamily protein [unclassified Janthinobacterium]SDA55672.1 4'-phosphopantetheinyl transferase [Janthinobacterium sp. 551a]SFB47359.1 4'-phosphopantetheinyl transferase [Janthinobacterium sp. 344]
MLEPAVFLWLVDLDDPALDALAPCLSAQEQARAARYRGDALQRGYRRARAALRHILAHHTGQPPATLALAEGPLGKPVLDGLALHFNLSHSGALALVAVASVPVGIDLEQRRARFDAAALAPLVCGPAEQADLAALPPALRQRHFLQLWTHKEAYCKLLGMGLRKDPALLAFGGAPGPAAVADAQEPRCAAWVYPLYPADGYAASLCVEKYGARPVWMRFRAWPAALLPLGQALA